MVFFITEMIDVYMYMYKTKLQSQREHFKFLKDFFFVFMKPNATESQPCLSDHLSRKATCLHWSPIVS